MQIMEFLTARLDEAESGWKTQKWSEDEGITEALFHFGRRLADEMLADIAAKRAILELHKQWPVLVEGPAKFDQPDASGLDSVAFKMSRQIAWMTDQEYRKRFGDEPPTSAIMRALASVYSDHPDYLEEWRA